MTLNDSFPGIPSHPSHPSFPSKPHLTHLTPKPPPCSAIKHSSECECHSGRSPLVIQGGTPECHHHSHLPTSKNLHSLQQTPPACGFGRRGGDNCIKSPQLATKNSITRGIFRLAALVGGGAYQNVCDPSGQSRITPKLPGYAIFEKKSIETLLKKDLLSMLQT